MYIIKDYIFSVFKNLNVFTKKVRSVFISLLFFCCLFFLSFQNMSLADEDEDFFNENEETFFIKDSTYDPFEKMNRKFFTFNTFIWDKAIVPFGLLYEKHIPLWFRWSFKNMVQNYTETPMDFALSTFDIDFESLVVSAWRFIFNSTFGLFGLQDIAYDLGLLSRRKSLGKIFLFYHIPRGPYLMIPFFGPFNIRDSSAMLFQLFFTSSICVNWVFNINSASKMYFYNALSPFSLGKADYLGWVALGYGGANLFNKVISSAGVIKALTESSLSDRYVTFRSGYYQNLDNEERKYLSERKSGAIKNNNVCDCENALFLPDECEDDDKVYDFDIGN